MKKKILHLIESSEAGGAETIYANIIRSLNKHKYVSIAGISGNGLWLTEILKDIELKIIRLVREKPFDLNFLHNLIHLVRRENVNLIHSHMFTMNFYGALSSMMTRTPLICTMHDTYYDLSKRKRILMYKFISAIAKSIVTVSHDMHTTVNDRISRKKNIKCILNGVDVKRFESKTKEKLRRSRDIPHGEFIIINVGNLYKVKNHLLLVYIAKRLTDVIPNFKLIIIGEGTARDDIEGKIRELSLQEKVVLLGLRKDVSEWLSLADVSVLPSRSEGLSISLLEAMSHGLPVIASNAGGNKDVIVKDKNGILVEDFGIYTYSEEILRLYQNPWLREYLGKNARSTVEEKFGAKRMVKQYEALYASCVR